MRTTAVAAALITAVSATAASAEQPATIVNQPAEQLAWARSPEGAEFADLWGERFAGEYGSFVQLPGGLVSPMHYKTADMHGIVLSGIFSHLAKGADSSTEVELPAGSYYMVPANVEHISRCVSAEPCVSFTSRAPSTSSRSRRIRRVRAGPGG